MWKELFARQPAIPQRREAADAPRLFGKLPGRDDFVRVGHQDAVGRSLVEWLQEGMNILGRRMNGAGSAGDLHFPATRFLWMGDEQLPACAGLLVPSRDRAGRAYPAVIYRAADATGGTEMTSVYADMFGRFQEAAEQWWRSLPNDAGRENLDQGLAALHEGEARRSRAAMLEHVAHTLRASRTDDLGEHWFAGDSARRMRDFTTGFLRLRETLLTRGAARINWGVRLPIGPRSMGHRCVLFWLSLFDALFRDRPWRAHAFWRWSQAELPGEITVFFRPPPPSYFMALAGLGGHDGTTMDVTTHFQGDISQAAAPVGAIQLPSCTLLELMYHWSRPH
ncbi:type VI secretion-associated protein [Thioalkalivibrio denitrificans]|uniref:Type VI secretion-associated protein n=1 Tax=Thioalkalivibrio denitrificans TaxID=108003 RepID=A0A1V3NEP4_9GAMM|nr:type VI secretion system-associated protein TagF [Thioalkalivibrio denitrificans]OOG23474.1 type VI secretion-associated protein [Thioalkalivibrio denitrificans]